MAESAVEKDKEKETYREFSPSDLGLDKSDMLFKTGSFRIGLKCLEFVTEKQAVKDLKTALLRHVKKDWGEADKNENDASLSNRGRVMSIFTIKEQQIWVITEYEGQNTMVLLPEEF